MGSSGSDSQRSASSPRDIAELFNDYFFYILTGNDDDIDLNDTPSNTAQACDISGISLSSEDILVALLNIDTSKAAGPDGISPRLLKETSCQIAPSLCLLLNQSLRNDSLPEE